MATSSQQNSKRYFDSSSSSDDSDSDDEDSSTSKKPDEAVQNGVAAAEETKEPTTNLSKCKDFLEKFVKPPIKAAKPAASTSSSTSSTSSDSDGEVAVPVQASKPTAPASKSARLELERSSQIEQVGFLAPQRPFKMPNVPDKLTLNKQAREIQLSLSKQGKYVSWNEILYELMAKYAPQVKHIGHLGLNKADDLHAVGELIRVNRKIDTFLLIYEFRLPCITLVDLERTLCNEMTYYLNKYPLSAGPVGRLDRFEQLGIGPLIKNNIVRKIFNISDDAKIVKQMKPISFVEVMKQVLSFLNDTQTWSSNRVEQADLEHYLAEKEGVSSVQMLGVKIINVGLLIGTLKSVQHLYAESLREAKQKLTSDYHHLHESQRELMITSLAEKFEAYRHMSRTSDDSDSAVLVGAEHKFCLSYLNKSSVEVIEELLGLFQSLLTHTEYYYLRDFLQLLGDSPYLRDVFQLAICFGSKDAFAALASIEKNSKSSIAAQPPSSEDKYQKRRRRQRQDSPPPLEENEFYFKYRNFLKRLFQMILDSYLSNPREAKKFLNRQLRTKDLKVVAIPASHQVFGDNSHSEEEESQNQPSESEESDNSEDSAEAKQGRNKKKNRKRKHSKNSVSTSEEKSTKRSRLKSECSSPRENDVTSDVLFEKEIEASLGQKAVLNELDDLLAIEKQVWKASTGRSSLLSFLASRRHALSFEFRLDGLSRSDRAAEAEQNEQDSERQHRILTTIFNLVHQTRSQLDEDEDAAQAGKYLRFLVCAYFGVRQLEELGVPGIEKHFEEILRASASLRRLTLKTAHSDELELQLEDGIVYEESLLNDWSVEAAGRLSSSENNLSFMANQKNVQKLRDHLISRLVNECPLLEDIESFLEWNQSGYNNTFNCRNVAEFLQTCKDVNVLETRSFDGRSRALVKVTRETSLDKLASFIEDSDFVNASGHFVSLIVFQYGSMKSLSAASIDGQSSRAELSKQLTKSFHELFRRSASIDHSHRGFYSFLVDFILRIPHRIMCQILLDRELFLDPLSSLCYDNAFSSLQDQTCKNIFDRILSRKLKALEDHVLGKSASCAEEMLLMDEDVRRFLALGESCSVKEWSRIYAKSFLETSRQSQRSEEPVQTMETLPADSELTSAEESTERDAIAVPEPEAQPSMPNGDSISVSASEADEEPIRSQHEHVMAIRKTYGIDNDCIEADESVRAITESLKGLIGRSLQSLSNELYNKDMHFLLELIQNADDNNYETRPDDQYLFEPTLFFSFEPDVIRLYNNESGFTQANMNALCDVKASTKALQSSRLSGLIGHKGIGFKSVFTVSNKPEIHSNGYHVRFDLENNGNIGYVLPTWIGESSSDDCQASRQLIKTQIAVLIHHLSKFKGQSRATTEATMESQAWSYLNGLEQKAGPLNTLIKLPLNTSSRNNKSGRLNLHLEDVNSNLLLFLNRLKNIAIFNEETAKNQSSCHKLFHRSDLSDNLVELSIYNFGFAKQAINQLALQRQKWLVLRESLLIPVNLRQDSQEQKTDLCLAFPVDSLVQNLSADSTSSSSSTKTDVAKSAREKMDVFAFLPVRSFGFKFIIQADFVLPASRQDLNQDSYWNKWLCDQVPKLFVESIELFKANRELFAGSSEDGEFGFLTAYLSLLPLDEEIVGSLFRRVPSRVIELLSKREFLPAYGLPQTGPSEAARIVWKRPNECVIINDEKVRQVLTSELLKKHFNCYYLHSSLAEWTNPLASELFSRLGVRYLNLNDILNVMKSSIFYPDDSDLSRQSQLYSNDFKTTVDFLVLIEHCLSAYSLKQVDSFLKQLRSLKFIPIKGAHAEQVELVSLSENKYVFLPNETGSYVASEGSGEPADAGKGYDIDLIKEDLYQVDIEKLLTAGNLVRNSQILSLLKRLGLRELNEEALLTKHILPKLTAIKNGSSTCDEVLLGNYLIYLKQFWQRDSTARLSQSLHSLKEFLPVKTNKGLRYVTDREKVYLSTEYGNKYNLAALLSQFDWCLVDDVYLKRTTEANEKTALSERISERNSWREFFMEYLGVHDVFEPESVMAAKEPTAFVDYLCPVVDHYFGLLTTVDDQLLFELSNLFQIINESWCWDSDDDQAERRARSQSRRFVHQKHTKRPLSEYKHVNSADGSIDEVSRTTPSSFYDKLKKTKWLVAERVEMKDDGQLHQSFQLEVASNIYSRNLAPIYGHVDVSYHAYKYEKDRARKKTDFEDLTTTESSKAYSTVFLQDLGMNHDFDADQLFGLVQSWSRRYSFQEKTRSPTAYSKCFLATREQMRDVYSRLSECLEVQDNHRLSKENQEALAQVIKNQSAPFVFVPIGVLQTSSSDSKRTHFYGKYCSVRQLYWNDPTGLFAKYDPRSNRADSPGCLCFNDVILLEKFYGHDDHLKRFFLDSLRIRPTPSPEEYVGLLEFICSQSSSSEGSEPRAEFMDLVNDAFSIFEYLLRSQVDSEWSGGSESPKSFNYRRCATFFRENEGAKLRLKGLLKDKQILPCYDKKFRCLLETGASSGTNLASVPILADEIDLAYQLKNKLSFIVIPKQHRLGRSHSGQAASSMSFQSLCRTDDLSETISFFLLNILEIPVLSQIVEPAVELIPPAAQINLLSTEMLQQTCSRLVGYVEQFLLSRVEFKAITDFVLESGEERFEEKLAATRVLCVDKIEPLFQYKHDTRVKLKVKHLKSLLAKPASSDWIYLVRSDQVANHLEIINSFVKIFFVESVRIAKESTTSPGDQSVDSNSLFSLNMYYRDELANYCLFVLSNPTGEQEHFGQEVEEQFKVKLGASTSSRLRLLHGSCQNGHASKLDSSRSEAEEPADSPFAHIDLARCESTPKRSQSRLSKLLEYQSSSRTPGELVVYDLGSSQEFDQTAAALDFKFPDDPEGEEPTNGGMDVEYSERTSMAIELGDQIKLKFETMGQDEKSRVKSINMNVGRWGEQWVHQLLQSHYKTEIKEGAVVLEWMNESCESGMPYDFRLTTTSSEKPEKKTIKFIEVKSTLKPEQSLFPISINEVTFLKANPEHYEIYRLSNVANGPSHVKLAIFKDISKKLNEHKLGLFLST